MKTILVDAVDAFVVETENGFEIFEPMRKILDDFPNRKIILTGANDEQFKKFGLDKMPYEVFTLKHVSYRRPTYVLTHSSPDPSCGREISRGRANPFPQTNCFALPSPH